jgi:hypothetical protein
MPWKDIGDIITERGGSDKNSSENSDSVIRTAGEARLPESPSLMNESSFQKHARESARAKE